MQKRADQKTVQTIIRRLYTIFLIIFLWSFTSCISLYYPNTNNLSNEKLLEEALHHDGEIKVITEAGKVFVFESIHKSSRGYLGSQSLSKARNSNGVQELSIDPRTIKEVKLRNSEGSKTLNQVVFSAIAIPVIIWYYNNRPKRTTKIKPLDPPDITIPMGFQFD